MATLLMIFSRVLAVVALILAGLFGWTAYAQPEVLAPLFRDLEPLVGTLLLIWAPAVWFLFVGLRLGTTIGAEHFYARSLNQVGRLYIAVFGTVAIASLVFGAMIQLELLGVQFTQPIVAFAQYGTLIGASVFAILATFGARRVMILSGLVQRDGVPILAVGADVALNKIRRDPLAYPGSLYAK